MSTSLPLIACSLDSEGQKERLADWASVLEQATERDATSEGVRYSFAADGELETHLRALATAEHNCCSFLDFELTRSDDRLEMKVRSAPGGLDALRFIFSG
jgi:hypothetical protein